MPAQDGLGALLGSTSAPHRAECWPLIRFGAILSKANALTVGERQPPLHQLQQFFEVPFILLGLAPHRIFM
jgi:hypothetical protein